MTGATALGAASGLAMELTGGAAKAVVSPIVGRALGVAGNAVTFGASSGAQEYTSQADEMAAGKRTGIDQGAVLSAGVEGAETGAGFGLLGGGKHPEGTQTGGEMTVKRGKTDGYIKPEAQKDRTGALPEPSTTPSSPTELIVGPTEKAALDANAGKAPTLGVGEQLGVAQEAAVQPSGETAQDQQGAPPAGQEAAPPSPPPPAAEASPAPTPAPPAPTVGPPVPETEATLRQQQAALMDPTNDREAMVYPLGTKPFDITANKWRYGTTKLPDGRVVQYDTRGPRAP